MKNLTRNQIGFLNQVVYGKWTFNPETGLVDVDGRVTTTKKIMDRNFGRLPVSFGAVDKVNFNFSGLLTLKGSPHTVYDTFYCNYNRLTSMEYAPLEVGYAISFTNGNPLKELNWKPTFISRVFELNMLYIHEEYVDGIISEIEAFVIPVLDVNKTDMLVYQSFRDAYYERKLIKLL